MKNLSRTLPTGLDREILLRTILMLVTFGLAAFSIWNLSAANEQRLLASGVLIRDACMLRHATELAQLGDSLVDRKMMFIDFAEFWRDKRRDFERNCLGKDV